jgi:hypothetical protein
VKAKTGSYPALAGSITQILVDIDLVDALPSCFSDVRHDLEEFSRFLLALDESLSQ